MLACQIDIQKDFVRNGYDVMFRVVKILAKKGHEACSEGMETYENFMKQKKLILQPCHEKCSNMQNQGEATSIDAAEHESCSIWREVHGKIHHLRSSLSQSLQQVCECISDMTNQYLKWTEICEDCDKARMSLSPWC